MRGFISLVETVFLPAIAAGLALGVAWRVVRPGALRTALQWIASLLFFVPQPFAIALGGQSAVLRPYQQTLIALWCLGICAMTTLRPPAARGAAASRRAASALVILPAGVIGLWYAWSAAGDYLLPRYVVAGVVTGGRRLDYGRSLASYRLMIDNRPYGITRDLIAGVRPGDSVEVDVGRGSRTIVALRRGRLR